MARKKLALIATHHISCTEDGDKNVLQLVFNRPLHRLEAMGIAMMVEKDLKEGS